MDKVDLSILIPARNEEYLALTVDSLLKNIRGNTEILVGLDGAWANPPIVDDPRVTILYHNESVGQRAMTNDLCKLSKAKWVMKIDAHCAVDEGFDVKMMDAMKGHDDWTMIPALYNLHVFNWKCKKCGNEWYQSPTPKHCQLPGEARKDNPDCDNTTDFEKIIIWKPRLSRRSECYRFDTTLHFQYHRQQMRTNQQDDIVETMSAQGSCFMLTREKYWELNICDEDFGSWGQQGTEVACKTWLSGGRLVTNRKTWYAHMFRTQGGDFGFPYPLSGTQVDHARQYSKDLFLENTWEGQIYPLSWLLEKFAPVPDWHTGTDNELLDKVMKAGEEFYKKQSHITTKGIIYYTDNQLPIKIAHAVQKQLKSIGLPIVSASLKPMEFGKNIHYQGKRGYLSMFKQILLAIENSSADILYFCEHDVLYHPSHFDFIPNNREKWYYNTNVWKIDAGSGHALHYDCKQVSGIAVYRDFALEHYRKRVAIVEEKLKELGEGEEFNRFIRSMGFEPGTHNRAERVDESTSEAWQSEFPNVDIRHNNNLSPTRWKKEQFRNQKYTVGWMEGNVDTIPGWKRENFSFL